MVPKLFFLLAAPADPPPALPTHSPPLHSLPARQPPWDGSFGSLSARHMHFQCVPRATQSDDLLPMDLQARNDRTHLQNLWTHCFQVFTIPTATLSLRHDCRRWRWCVSALADWPRPWFTPCPGDACAARDQCLAHAIRGRATWLNTTARQAACRRRGGGVEGPETRAVIT